MELSIIIVSRNTRDLLRDSLKSLQRTTGTSSTETWVIDNASDDGSVQMVQAEFPEVRLIVNQENLGFARANNQALAQSAGRYCLLLNPDTVVPSGVLDRLMQFMEDAPDAGVAGCAQVYPDGQWQVTCHRTITLAREAFVAFGLAGVFRRLIDYGVRPDQFHAPRQVDWVEGGALLIRRTALETVGLMDDAFFMYAEDTDLCLRVRQAGFRVYYVPDVQIVHYRAQATGFVQRERRKRRVNATLLVALHQSKAYYIRKHYGAWQEKVYWLLVRVYSLRKLSMGLVSYLLRVTDRETWRDIARAYRDLMTADVDPYSKFHEA